MMEVVGGFWVNPNRGGGGWEQTDTHINTHTHKLWTWLSADVRASKRIIDGSCPAWNHRLWIHFYINNYNQTSDALKSNTNGRKRDLLWLENTWEIKCVCWNTRGRKSGLIKHVWINNNNNTTTPFTLNQETSIFVTQRIITWRRNKLPDGP